MEQCISDSCRDGILLVSVKNYQFKRQLFSKFTIFEDMKHANRAIFNQFSKAIGAAMVLLVFALWLVQKTHATFSTNQEPN